MKPRCVSRLQDWPFPLPLLDPRALAAHYHSHENGASLSLHDLISQCQLMSLCCLSASARWCSFPHPVFCQATAPSGPPAQGDPLQCQQHRALQGRERAILGMSRWQSHNTQPKRGGTTLHTHSSLCCFESVSLKRNHPFQVCSQSPNAPTDEGNCVLHIKVM